MNERRVNYCIVAVSLLALALFYFIVNAFYAFYPHDDGFIFGLSWRILNGQVPYRDFIYMRPPLTPYLHTIELLLPETWQFLAGRLAFYLEMALAMALPTMWAIWSGRLRLGLFNIFLLVSFFCLSVNNFSPMPWHTVDAVMFSYAALTCLLVSLRIRSTFGRFSFAALSSVLALMAALCKQNFILVWFVIALIYTIICLNAYRKSHNSREVGQLLGSLAPFFGAAIAVGLGIVSWLLTVDAFSAAWTQLGHASTFREFLQGGITAYFDRPQLLVVLGLAIPFAGRVNAKVMLWVKPVVALALLFIAITMAYWPYAGVFMVGISLFWFFAGLVAGWLLSKLIAHSDLGPDTDILALYICTLAIMWISSISYTYWTPILGIGPA